MKYKHIYSAIFLKIFISTSEIQSMDLLKDGWNVGKLFLKSLVCEIPNPHDPSKLIPPAFPVKGIVNGLLSLRPSHVTSHITNQIRQNPIDTFSTTVCILLSQGVISDSSPLNLISFGLVSLKRVINLAEFSAKSFPLLDHFSIVDQNTGEVLEILEPEAEKIDVADILQASIDIYLIYQGIEFYSRTYNDEICGEIKKGGWKGCYPAETVKESISKFSKMNVLPGNQCSKDYLFEGQSNSHSASLIEKLTDLLHGKQSSIERHIEHQYVKLENIPQEGLNILLELKSLQEKCFGFFCDIDTKNNINTLNQKYALLNAEKKHLVFDIVENYIDGGYLAEAHHVLINSITLNSEDAFSPNFVEITGINTLHQQNFKGQNSTLLVLDTPLDLESMLHPNQIELLSTDAIYKNEADTHATHVVGIIQQMAPQSTIKADIVENALSTNPSIRKTYDTTDIDAVSISMDLPFLDESRDSIIELALVIKEWIKKDTAIFLAFGNDGNSENKKFYDKYHKLLSQFTTASFFENRIIVVGNLNYYQSLNEFPTKESSSNFCETSQRNVIFAPGTNICSTLPNNQVGLKTGTSMATPVVSGAFATLRSLFSRDYHSNHAIADLMMRSADKNINALPEEIDQYGVGVLNIENAINLAKSEGWVLN